jgi:hypothetical protein
MNNNKYNHHNWTCGKRCIIIRPRVIIYIFFLKYRFPCTLIPTTLRLDHVIRFRWYGVFENIHKVYKDCSSCRRQYHRRSKCRIVINDESKPFIIYTVTLYLLLHSPDKINKPTLTKSALFGGTREL